MSQSTDSGTTRSMSIGRIAFASLIGTTIEWYDFFLYGTAAALIFSHAFFPNVDPTAGTLASFATFAVGFIARPIGGFLGGHFGDKIGRKAMLVATLLITGTTTFLVGLLPTYQQIGIAAPILLVILRFIQGIGVGGEWGGAVLVAVEHAPEHKRGFYGSLPQLGVAAGLSLGTVMFAIVGALPDDDFHAWGWRIPFLLSALLVVVGLIIRSRVEETPVFKEMKAKKTVQRLPIVEAVRQYPGRIVQASMISFGAILIFFIVTVFTLSYATKQLGVARNTILIAIVVVAAAEFIALPAWSALSDKIGRRPVFLIGAIFTALFAFPYFWLVDTGNTVAVFVAFLAIWLVGHAATYGVSAAFLMEMFPGEVRYSAASVSYQLSSIVAGGFTPMIATTLLEWSDNESWSVALYLLTGGLITVIGGLLAKETREGSHRASRSDSDTTHTTTA
ncbi:MFS transporter [Streptomyces iranensis]|uniref:Putative proline/betaine transporter n=1 Tax=Streptomyces iranensis TaxID=576784 RepID=A0A060ZWC8_9ACTN|nr:MFS transporter [Streptomyces iranensis]MBP2064938.1 metabolite-proton symporter [Streptomyces iranensis]CDR10116.1 General substrate transporter [Streptomyces iranensis]